MNTSSLSFYEANLAANLPPEVWLEIFSYAAWIPGAFSISDHHAIAAFALDQYGMSLRNRFDAATKGNLAVSLVCKAWNFLVQETMVRYLLVRSGDQATRIADMLDRRKCSSDIGPWWTHRLEIRLDGVHIWTSAHTNAIIRIIRNCPNLVIFSTVFCTATAPSFYATILLVLKEICAHAKIRRLELKGDAELLNRASTMLASSLEVFWASPARTTTYMPKLSTCCLPKLHTLISTFGYGSGPTKEWDMPSLQTLRADDSLDLNSCLQKNGHNLRHLSIPNASLMVSSLSHCPHLHELGIHFCYQANLSFDDRISEKLRGIPTHTSLRCIVLHIPTLSHPHHRQENYDTCDFVYRLRVILSAVSSELSFPFLECIRFLLPLRCEAFECNPQSILMFKTWLSSVQARGVQVQYCRGAEDCTADANWQPFTVDFVEFSLY